MIISIFLFSFIYYLGQESIIRTDLQNGVESLNSYDEALYFSFVTFTNLGYNDFHPNHDLPSSWWIRICCSFQAVIGFVSLAMMIAIFLQFMKKD